MLFFMMNILIFYLYNSTDNLQKSSYREFKSDYCKIAKTEQERLEIAREECVKRLVIINYEEQIKRGETDDNSAIGSKILVEEQGYSEDWLKKVIKEYVTNNSLKHTTKIGEKEYLIEVLQELKQVSSYHEYLESVQSEIHNKQSIKFFEKNQSNFSKRDLIKKSRDYKSMENVEPVFAGTIGLAKILGNCLFDICPFLMVTILCILLFIEEKKDGMVYLYQSTINGRGILLLIKMLILFVSCFVIALIFYGSIGIIVRQLYGSISWNAPIQSIYGYQGSTMHLTIGMYLLKYLFCKVLCMFVMGVVFSLFAIFTKNYLIYFIYATVFFLISVLCYLWIPPYTAISYFKYFNFVYIIKVAPVFRDYLNFDFINQPYAQRCVITFLLFFIGSIAFVCVLHCYKNSGNIVQRELLFKRRIVNGKKKKRTICSFFYQESLKIFIGEKVILVLIIFAGIMYCFAKYKTASLTEYEYDYRNYMKALEGDVTEEKKKLIETEEKRISDVELQIENTNKSYEKGEISEEMRNQLVGMLEIKISSKVAFERVKSQLKYIEENKERKFSFVYEDGWKLIFGFTDEGKSRDKVNALLILLIEILCFGGLFANDYENGMSMFQTTSKLGIKHVRITKILIALVISILSIAIVSTCDFIYVQNNYGVHSILRKAGSIQSLFRCKGSILSCYILVCMIKIVGSLIVALIMFRVSALTKNTLNTILFALLVFVIPVILSCLGLQIIDRFSLNHIFFGNDMLHFLI